MNLPGKRDAADGTVYGRPPKYPWRKTATGGRFFVPRERLPNGGINGIQSAARFAEYSGHGTFRVLRSLGGGAVVTRLS